MHKFKIWRARKSHALAKFSLKRTIGWCTEFLQNHSIWMHSMAVFVIRWGQWIHVVAKTNEMINQFNKHWQIILMDIIIASKTAPHYFGFWTTVSMSALDTDGMCTVLICKHNENNIDDHCSTHVWIWKL